MSKKRRTPIQFDLEDPGEEQSLQEGVDEEGNRQRVAPNTNFLGRLMRGVTTGNQRQIDTTTSNAANLSIGATGAASLRLQLQRAAAARTARYQTLRRVVLSSAEQQRLTLCSALLAEVAQGFGFRLNIRRPDGREVGARQAINAAAAAQPAAGPSSGGAGEAEAVADADAPAEAQGAEGDGEGGGAPGATTPGQVGGAEAPADPFDGMEPLDVELDLDSDGVLLQGLQQQQALAAGRVGAGLARSPSGSRPARPGGANALLSGRLMSATLGSMGLTVKKRTAAAQALQTARRRALMRAASNGSVEDTAAAAAADAAGDTAAPGGHAAPAMEEDVALATQADDDAPDATAAAAAAVPAAAFAAVGAAATGCNMSGASADRRIVWDAEKVLAKPVAGAAATDTGPGLAGAARLSDAVAPPPSKRPRTSPAAAGASATVTPAESGDSKGYDLEIAGGNNREALLEGDGEMDIAGEKPAGGTDRVSPQPEDVVMASARPDVAVQGGSNGGGREVAEGGASEHSGAPERRPGDSTREAELDPKSRRVQDGGKGTNQLTRAPLQAKQAAGVSRAGRTTVGVSEAEAGSSEQTGLEPQARTADGGPGARMPGAVSGSRPARGGRAGGMLMASPAGKLFGAAVRQLQRRSQG